MLPLLRGAGREYRKLRGVRARLARPGEVVRTCPADGEETVQTARADHVYVQALTAAGEQYLLERQVFDARYTGTGELGEHLTCYEPKGRILAIDVNDALLDTLGQAREFLIEAPWGSNMVVRAGDKLASPLPDLDQIYRIAAVEFAETYAAIDAGN